MIKRHKKQLVEAADLGDARLNKRLGHCFETFVYHMEESIPSAMQDLHQAKAGGAPTVIKINKIMNIETSVGRPEYRMSKGY